MLVIENKYWRGEPLKAVIKFDENTEYTVFTNTEQTSDSNWIYKASFSLSEGNNKVNPLGISTSNKVNLQIYDKDDSLSPANTKSTLYGKVVNVCLDPTLLTDINTWNNIKSKKKIEKDCIVLYQVRWNEGEEDTLEEKAYQLAKQTKANVINLSNREYRVEEWVLYIKYAKCVVTSSFHASVFALIFNRPLYSFVLNDGRDSRYVDLLNSIGASECLKDLHDSISELPEMDFRTINERLQFLRQDSLTYLKEQIK